MCWLYSSMLCWTYLHCAGELVASSASFFSGSSLEKHTLRWLRVPLDTKLSSSSLGKGEELQRHVQNILGHQKHNCLQGYTCDLFRLQKILAKLGQKTRLSFNYDDTNKKKCISIQSCVTVISISLTTISPRCEIGCNLTPPSVLCYTLLLLILSVL